MAYEKNEYEANWKFKKIDYRRWWIAVLTPPMFGVIFLLNIVLAVGVDVGAGGEGGAGKEVGTDKDVSVLSSTSGIGSKMKSIYVRLSHIYAKNKNLQNWKIPLIIGGVTGSSICCVDCSSCGWVTIVSIGASCDCTVLLTGRAVCTFGLTLTRGRRKTMIYLNTKHQS